MIDLAPRHYETVKMILNRLVPEYEIRAFGSRVAGSARPHSDLDLVVIGERPLPFERMCRLREAFEESDLPFRVEVLDWHSLTEVFRAVIMSRSEVLQHGYKRPSNKESTS